MPQSTTTTTSASTPTRAPGGPRLSADERRADVIEAAVKAFASGGLAGTSTEEIARLAGVSQPYLFRLFGTKRELFIAAVDRSMTRIADTFTEAARHPVEDPPDDHNGQLLAMGLAYQDLLRDRTLLRIQLHAFAAADDPEVRAFVRARFADLVRHVAAVAGVPAASLRTFFAEGMLLNIAAALDLSEADVAWQRMCEGDQRSRT
jgi:AcrR family transcriptional regulator